MAIMKDSFVHLFETEMRKYVFDVNSNNIFQVNEIAYDFLNLLFLDMEENQIASILTNKYDGNDVHDAIHGLKQLEKSGLCFSKKRPKTCYMFCCRESWDKFYGLYQDHLILEVTQRCNMNCLYCSFSGIYECERTHTNIDMSWETAQKSIDYLFTKEGREPSYFQYYKTKEEGTDYSIGFYGGEPLLNLSLIRKCVQYALEKCPSDKTVGFTMTTNGTLLNEDIIDFILKHDIKITLSLDGPKHVHDMARVYKNGRSTYDDVMSALQRIAAKASLVKKNKQFFITINCVIKGGIDVGELWEYFVSLEHLLHTEDVQSTVRLSFVNGGTEKWNDIYPEKKLTKLTGYDELVAEYKRKCEEGFYYNTNTKNQEWRYRLLHEFAYNYVYFDLHGRTRYQFEEETELRDNHHPGGICKLGIRRLYVKADGTLLPCERVASNLEYYKIGHIHNGGLNLDRVIEIMNEYSQSTAESCKDCWCIRMCDVGCIRSMVSSDGTFKKNIKDGLCLNTRKKRHKELIEMMTLLEKNPYALEHYNEIVSF